MVTTIRPLPTPGPDRTDRTTFASRFWNWIQALPNTVSDMNALGSDMQPVIDALPSLLGYMGFKGLWSAQVGVVTLPYSVYHNGVIWYALQPGFTVSAQTPAAGSAYWAEYKLGGPVLIETLDQTGGPSALTFTNSAIQSYDSFLLEYSLAPATGTYTVQLQFRRIGVFGTTITIASGVSNAVGFARISNLHRNRGYLELRNGTNFSALVNVQATEIPFGSAVTTDQIRLNFSAASFNSGSYYAKLYGIQKA